MLIVVFVAACSDADTSSDGDPTPALSAESDAARRAAEVAQRLSAAQQVEHAELLERWLRAQGHAR